MDACLDQRNIYFLFLFFGIFPLCSHDNNHQHMAKLAFQNKHKLLGICLNYPNYILARWEKLCLIFLKKRLIDDIEQVEKDK